MKKLNKIAADPPKQVDPHFSAVRNEVYLSNYHTGGSREGDSKE